MRKSILLFFLLLFSIVLWKITESPQQEQWNDAAVEELVSETNNAKIAKN